jgi:hypothetical protein
MARKADADDDESEARPFGGRASFRLPQKTSDESEEKKR